MTEGNIENSDSLSYSQKVELIQDLFAAAETRNNYAIDRYGSFEDFASLTGHDSEERKEYSNLQKVFENLRANVEETITDKEEFATQLEEAGEEELAEKFRRMFRTPKPQKPRRKLGESIKDFLTDESS